MGWDMFRKNVHFKVGVGDKVKFWTNRWCGDFPLQLAFPVLYTFAAKKEASVESSLLCQGEGNRRTWDVRFIRGPNVVVDFFRFLASNQSPVTEGDRMRWKLTKNEDFTICSFYHKLHGRSRHSGVSLSLYGQWHGIGFSQEII